MNKRARVVVQTPHGQTAQFITDPIVKQGTVLGPMLCSSSTGEHCDENPGVAIGTLFLASLLYVDDIIDITSTISDRTKAHSLTMLFGKKKKLFYSGTKCFSMCINCDSDGVPVLKISEESNVVDTEEIIYLGDVFNDKGNNSGLIRDRVKRGTKAMVTIMSLLAENEVGVHHMNVLLLLYQALFLATTLFNSQTWSKLRQEDTDKLKVMQLRYLKRAIGVAAGAPNSVVYLELGVLPITAEIHKRQLMFLHRILNLEHTDPVYQMFENMISYSAAGERNWWSQVEGLLDTYEIGKDLKNLKTLSKDQYKTMINKKVKEVVLGVLNREYQALKKDRTMVYSSLQLQEYFQFLFPNQSRIVFMARSKMLDIKTHRTHVYNDSVCRNCGVEEESLEHIVNCGWAPCDHIKINLEQINEQMKWELVNLVNRIETFMGRIGKA